ncbi:MAG TPA: transglycosylase domain-containing protein [Candidatus Saccharimonadales bacterium]|nr:transglycosylase domain-containing protein [Candidatus Saccharimonadales bacterium]
MSKKPNRKASALNVYSNLVARHKNKRDARSRRKAEYLASLPKNPVKRFLYRLRPKELARFWFSREGLKTFLKLLAVGAVILAIFVAALFAYYRKELDTIRPDEIASRVQSTVTKYYDRNDVLLWEDKGEGNYKVVVEGSEIAQVMKDATVSIEDKDFYNHPGVSFTGIVRAGINNLFGSGNTQGASTLTQQLIKQIFFQEESEQNRLSISRKIKEAILALEVERMYNKDQILTLYLNEVPYGGRRNGVESAAQTYFGKSAKDLNIAEAALLASIPQNPSYYDPYTLTPDGASDLIERQQYVIDQMVEQGYITQDQATEAKAFAILDTVKPEIAATENIKAPHFVLAARESLEAEFGKKLVREGGLTVKTTLDYRIQQIAEQAVIDNEQYIRGNGSDNTAVTSVDVPTGQVLSMVGSLGFNIPGYGQKNAATSTLEPGSSIKPFIYSNLFKQREGVNYGAGSQLLDENIDRYYCLGTPAPCHLANFDNGYQGTMSVRKALGNSRNPPAVEAMMITGPDSAIETARSAGDKSYCEGAASFTLSSAIGGGCSVSPVEHANSYATLARQGVYKPVAYILEVKNSQGQVIKQWKDESENVLDPQITYIISDILSDPGARNPALGSLNTPGRGAVISGVKTATKTGTTDNAKDSWMMSYSPRMAAGVWVGRHDGSWNGLVASNQGTGRVINDLMSRAHKEVFAADGTWKEGDWFTRPSGVQNVNVNGTNDLFPSWYSKPKNADGEKVMFDTVSKKKATNCTPERAKYEITVTTFDNPLTGKSEKRAPDGYDPNADDDVHKCDDVKPSVTITTDPVGNPADKKFKITATITQGTHPLSFYEVKVDDQLINSQSISAPGSYSTEHTFTSSGSKSITVTVYDTAKYDGSSTKSLNVATTTSGSTPTLPLGRRRG